MIFSLPIFEQWGKKNELHVCVCLFFALFIYRSITVPNYRRLLFRECTAQISFFLKRQMVSLQLLAFSFLYLNWLCPLANGRYIFLMDGRETIEENVGQASYYVIWLFCAVYFIIDLSIKRHYGWVNSGFFNFGLTIFDTAKAQRSTSFTRCPGRGRGNKLIPPTRHTRRSFQSSRTQNKKPQKKFKKKDKFIYLVFGGFVLFPECKWIKNFLFYFGISIFVILTFCFHLTFYLNK